MYFLLNHTQHLPSIHINIAPSITIGLAIIGSKRCRYVRQLDQDAYLAEVASQSE
jgi:hypothetical protein